MPRYHLRRLAHFVLSAALLGSAGVSPAAASDQIPGAPQKKPIALVNGVVHTLTGQPIQEGTVILYEGKVSEVGHKLQPPAGADVIDLKGQHVYPSFIEAHSHLGLQELSSTRATIDTAETGNINPNVSAHVAVNPDSELIPVTRANGVLVALSAPTGGTVSGKASVMMLDGWTFEQMTLKADAGLWVNWPRTGSSFRGFFPGPAPSPTPGPGPSATPSQGEGDSGVKELRDLFDQARAYAKARAANPASQRFDLKLQAMEPVITGKIPLMVSADRAAQIQSAVAFGVEQNVKIIIFGGYDAPACAELLKRYDVPVIVDSVHRDPQRDHENYDAAYTLPERLRRAGVRFCISGSGRAETYNTRNLPYQAATAVAYGLPPEEGLKSVTLYPAQILGVADRLGTIEKGKDATLFVATGDPLETPTQITHAWIQGRRVDLTSRHTQLNQKYTEKYRQLSEKR